MRISTLLAPMTLLLAACSTTPSGSASPPAQLRLATYNTSLYSEEEGGLIRELQGDSAHVSISTRQILRQLYILYAVMLCLLLLSHGRKTCHPENAPAGNSLPQWFKRDPDN